MSPVGRRRARKPPTKSEEAATKPPREGLTHHAPRTTQRNPMWVVELSTASPWRAAGR